MDWQTSASTALAICPLEKMWALHLAAPESVQLWVAEREGRMLCGQLYFVHNSHASIYNKGARREAFEARAPTLLDWTMIGQFAAVGLRWYDMGESGGSQSARAYKLRICRHETDASVHVHLVPALEAARRAVKTLRTLSRKAATLST